MKMAFNVAKKAPVKGVFSEPVEEAPKNVELISTFSAKPEVEEKPSIPLAIQRAPAAVTLSFTPKAAIPPPAPSEPTDPNKKYGLIKTVKKSAPKPVESTEPTPSPVPAPALSIEEQAIAELTKGVEKEVQLATVPLLMQSRIAGLDEIEDEAEKFKKDVESRPDVCTAEDYETMPVENFGEALLRGMGWEKGKSIGLNNKGLVEPIEYVRRANQRGGLGSKPPPPPPSSKIRKPGEEVDTGPMVMPTGPDGRVRHTKTLDEKLIPLAEAQRQEVKRRRTEERAPEREKERTEQASGSRSRTQRGWLCENLTVRIVSKSFSEGKYYREKGLVVDVPMPELAVLRLSNGRTVDAPSSVLETVIPSVGASVRILARGPEFHLRAKLLSKNSEKNRAQVQLPDTTIVTYSLDELCQC